MGDNIEEQIRNRETTESPTTNFTSTAGLRTDIFLRQSPLGRTDDPVQTDGIGLSGTVDDGDAGGESSSASDLREQLARLRAEAEERLETKDRLNRQIQREQKANFDAQLARADAIGAQLRSDNAQLDAQLRSDRAQLESVSLRLKTVAAQLSTTETDNGQLRVALKEKEAELTETRRKLKETKDLVNAVKTELSILSKMKKDRRAKEKKTEVDFAEYLKEMDKLRSQLQEAVKENQR